MMKNTKYIIILAGILTFPACDTEDELRDDIISDTEPVIVTPEGGSADFTNYVSIGASITSGFMDGALYTTGQETSYPNLLSEQFALVGGRAFGQPDIGTNVGFNALLNDLAMAFDTAAFGKFKLDVTIPGPSAVKPGVPLTMFSGSVNNFGVPGARVVDAAVNGYGSFNPYYGRFAGSASASILEEALAAGPTFYTLWLGGNDLLGYATAGGTSGSATNPAPVPPDNLVVGVAASGAPIFQPNVTEVAPGVFAALNTIPGITDYYKTNISANPNSTTPSELASNTGITNELVFKRDFGAILGALDAIADGVVMNIPDVTLLPVFNLVPIDLLKVPLNLSVVLPTEIGAALGFPVGATFATALNTIYAQFGFANDPATGLPTRQIFDATADNGLVIETFDANGNRIFRQIASTDKVLLSIPLDSLAAGWGSLTGIVFDANGDIDIVATDLTALRPFPIPSQYVLDADELSALQDRVVLYNDAIEKVAGGLSVPVVDISNLLSSAALNGGIEVGGQLLQYDFTPNGFFSTDGLHPNSRGQAILANEILGVINASFGATIPDVDVLALPGVTLK